MRDRLIFTANLIALVIFYISAFAGERQKIQLKTTVDHVALSSELKREANITATLAPNRQIC